MGREKRSDRYLLSLVPSLSFFLIKKKKNFYYGNFSTHTAREGTQGISVDPKLRFVTHFFPSKKARKTLLSQKSVTFQLLFFLAIYLELAHFCRSQHSSLLMKRLLPEFFRSPAAPAGCLHKAKRRE